MKYCKICGEKLEDNDLFCGSCGARADVYPDCKPEAGEISGNRTEEKSGVEKNGAPEYSSGKPAFIKSESVKPDDINPAPVISEYAKPAPVKPVSVNSENTKPAYTDTEPVRNELPETDNARPETNQFMTGRTEEQVSGTDSSKTASGNILMNFAIFLTVVVILACAVIAFLRFKNIVFPTADDSAEKNIAAVASEKEDKTEKAEGKAENLMQSAEEEDEEGDDDKEEKSGDLAEAEAEERALELARAEARVKEAEKRAEEAEEKMKAAEIELSEKEKEEKGIEYLYEDSDKTRITSYDVMNISEKISKYRIAIPGNRTVEQMIINEIYARNGYDFGDYGLKQFFLSKSWYMPDTNDMKVVESRLNNYEKDNVLILRGEDPDSGS